MHLEGSFVTPANRDIVWDFLLNPNEIGQCFPDLQSINVLSPDSFQAKVRVGLSVVKGTMDFEFKVTDKNPLSSAKLVGVGKGVGSTVELETTFTLTEERPGTRVGWVAEVKVGGIMAGLGTKLLDSSSRKIVSDVVGNLQSKLKAKAVA